MTSPPLALETPSGRYYEDPISGELYVSVTNVIGTAVGLQHYLTPWGASLAIQHIARHMDEWTDAFLADRDAAIKEFKERCKDERDESWQFGDRIHTGAQAMLLGAPYAAEPDVQPFLDMLVNWLNAWGVTPKQVWATECSVLSTMYGYAGTADLILWLPTGPDGAMELWLIDFKTSLKHASTHYTREHKLQLAALASAEFVWLPNGTRHKMPKIQRAGILNLRQRRISLLPLEDEGEPFAAAVEQAMAAFSCLLAGTHWLHAQQGTSRTLKDVVKPPAPLVKPGTPPKEKSRRPGTQRAARQTSTKNQGAAS
jgi:hypothetical protein